MHVFAAAAQTTNALVVSEEHNRDVVIQRMAGQVRKGFS